MVNVRTTCKIFHEMKEEDNTNLDEMAENSPAISSSYRYNKNISNSPINVII